MVWKVLVASGLALVLGTQVGHADKKDDKAEESYVKVEIKGTLQTGVAAIGGETTGTVIRTKNGTLELDLAKDKDLQAQANKLNGKTVLVTDSLTVRRGVEVRQRYIVTVASLKPADKEE